MGKIAPVLLLAVATLAAAASAGSGQPAYAATFVVNSTTDAVDANPGNGVCATAGGQCTLRAAIQEANALSGADFVNLGTANYALTIDGVAEEAAATGDLDITGDLNIFGGVGPTVIDGGSLDRVLDIRSGTVGITKVTIQNGLASADYGGGILVGAGTTLFLTGSTVSANRTHSFGGGIFNFGTIYISNSTISGNTASNAMDGFGGGILSDGTAHLFNSTVSGNSSNRAGGGILHGFNNPSSTLTLTSSTVSDNTAGTHSGGIGGGPTARLKNTIVANNPGGNCGGLVTSDGHNLENSATCGFTAAGDLINTDPQLGPLQNNGGLYQTETHALLPGSPAIDAGDNVGCPPADQRGVARPQGARCDIGSYEFEGPGTAPVCSGASVTTNEDTSSAPFSLNCSDIDGDALTCSVVTQGTKGILAPAPFPPTPPYITSCTSATYIPNANANGADAVVYKANDGTADSANATVSITINPVNDPPVCAGASVTTNEDTTSSAFSLNCFDVEGDALTCSVVTQGTKGTLNITSCVSATYIPNANANGADTVVYKANDGSADSANATVNVTILADTGGYYHPVTPCRILDTRSGPQGMPPGRVGHNSEITVDVTEVTGVPCQTPPSNASAVVMNVTVTEPAAGSYLTVYPSGETRPLASNLNFGPGQTVPNLVTVKVGEDGNVTVYNAVGQTHVIFDIVGWYGGPTGGSRFNALPPFRLLDTRLGEPAPGPKGKIGPNGTITVDVTGVAGSLVPSSGVSAVVVNATVTEPTSGSFLTVFPSDAALPLASNLNFGAGQTVPNLVTVKVGTDGNVKVYNKLGSVHVILDVVGWYGATGDLFRPVVPCRNWDSRPEEPAPGPKGKIPAASSVSVDVTGPCAVPASGVSAVIVNTTVTQPTDSSYLTVYPTDPPLPDPPPFASNLNFGSGQTIANLVIVKVGPDGNVRAYNAVGQTHALFDVVGYFASGP